MKTENKYQPLGQIFKTLRESENLTQEELGNKFNLHVQNVSNWERGKALPQKAPMIYFLDLMSEKDISFFRNKLAFILADHFLKKFHGNKKVKKVVAS